MTLTTSLTTQNIFSSIISNYYMDMRKKNTQKSSTQIRNAQMDGGSNCHMFTVIIILTYIRPIKCNVKILNDIKAPVKGFGLVVIKPPKTNIIITLCTSYYIPQNPQNTISQTAIKNYNQFRSGITEALRCLEITT